MKHFFYQEETSSLLDSERNFIKYVFCPKANKLNQLLRDIKNQATLACGICGDDVINLDSMDYEDSLKKIKEKNNTCVYAPASTNKVIFLKKYSSPLSAGYFKEKDKLANPNNYIEIRVETNIDAINHAAKLGYWPDSKIKKMEYQSKFFFQNLQTGEIVVKENLEDKNFLLESYVNPLSDFVNNDIASYLIPPNLKEGDMVHIPTLINLPNDHKLKNFPASCSGDAMYRNKSLIVDSNTLVPSFFLIG